MSQEDLGLNLNLHFGLVDHRHQDILEAPADNQTVNILSPGTKEAKQLRQYREDPSGVTH